MMTYQKPRVGGLLLATCLLSVCPVWAQVEADAFGGGAGDGHGVVSGVIAFDNTPLAPIYGGGAGDGHDVTSGLLAFDNSALAPLYGGGLGDGFDSRNGFLELSGGALAQIYSGGAGDGYDALTGTLQFVGSPVPATLLRFTATATATGEVRVAWSVADERDVDHYAVERGSDRRAFAEVGRRAAAATNATSRHYDLTDAHPLPGPSYYRLRTVDSDGSSALSDVVVVVLPDSQGTWTLRAFPNPVAAGQPLRLASEGLPGAAPLVLSVHDAVGRLVARRTLVSSGGREVLALPAIELAPGAYRLRVAHPSAGVRSQLLTVVQ